MKRIVLLFICTVTSLLVAKAQIPSTANLVADGEVNASVVVYTSSGPRIHVGGDFTAFGDPNSANFAAVNASGQNVANALPTMNGQVNKILADGSNLYVVGRFIRVGGVLRNGIVKLNAQRQIDVNFNPAIDFIDTSTTGTFEINDIAINGNLIAISGYFRVNGTELRRIALIDKATGSVYSWTPNLSVSSSLIYDVEFNNSLLFVGGKFDITSVVNGNVTVVRKAFAAYIISNPNSVTLSGAFNFGLSNPNGWQPIVYTLATSGTTLYIGGNFEGGTGFVSQNIISVNMTSGTRNSNFNAGLSSPNNNAYLSSYVTTIVAVSSNIIFVGGKFYTPYLGGIRRANFALLSSTGGFSNAPQFNIADFDNTIIRNISVVNTGTNTFRLFLSGPFSSILNSNRRFKGMLAYDFNSSNYSFALNSQILDGTAGPITSCFRDGTSTYILGGSFSFAGGTRCPHLATFTHTGNLDMTTTNGFFMNSFGNMSIKSMALIGTNIYLGGSFKPSNSSMPSSGRNDLMKISRTTLITDNNFPQLDGTFGNVVNVLAGEGSELFIGGSFSRYLTQTGAPVLKPNFIAWNIGTNSVINYTPNILGTVTDIAFNYNNLFVAGSFSAPLSGSSPAIAKFLRSTSSLTFQTFSTSNVHSNITSLEVINANMYVGEKNAIFVYDISGISSNPYKAKYNLPTPTNTMVTSILPITSTTVAVGFNTGKLYLGPIHSGAVFQTYSMYEDTRVLSNFKSLYLPNWNAIKLVGVYRSPLWFHSKGGTTGFGNGTSTFVAFNASFVPPAPPAPTVGASNMSFSNIEAFNLRMSCNSGNGSGRIVLARKGGIPVIPATFPSTIIGSTIFGNGTNFGSGTFCVSNSSGVINNLTITNLQALSSYTFSVIEYNTLGTVRTYNTTSILTNSTMTLNNVIFGCLDNPNLYSTVITSNSIGVGLWGNSTLNRRYIIKQGANSISFVPQNGMAYYPGPLPDGSQLSNSPTFNSLTPGTTYSVACIQFNNSNQYCSNLSKTNFTTSSFAPLPTTQAFNINITPSKTSASISWNGGNGGRSTVIVSKLPNAPIIGNNTINAINGTNYVGNANMAVSSSSSMLTYINGVSQNAQVVYHGIGNSVVVNGLNPGSVYQVAVFMSNGGGFGSAGQVVYLTSQRPTATFSTKPLIVAPSAITFTHNITVSQDDARLNYSGGNGNRSLVILKKDGPVNFAPINDSFYIHNWSFGLGNQLGLGNYAIMNNNPNGEVIAYNLEADAEYHFAIFQYNTDDIFQPQEIKYNPNPYRGVFRTSRAWPVRAGGPKKDAGGGVVTDASGNVYVAGTFETFGSWGTSSLPSSGGNDIFLTKYSPNGKPLWVVKQGGGDADAASALAIDNSGNLIMTGSFRGTGNFGIPLVSNGIDDIFISKLDPSGNVIWSKRAGGADQDVAFSIAADNNGDFYIAGYFRGTITFPNSSTTMTSLGGTDALLAKYDGNGNLLWAKSGGGTGNDFAYGVSVRGSNVAMVGQFESSATFNSSNLLSAGQSDIFIAEYSGSNGSLNWVNKFGGTGNDIAFSITTASSDYVIAGQFANSVTIGSTTLNSAGNSDVLVVKVNSSGTPVWFKRAGGISQDAGRGIAINSVGDKLFVTGSFAESAVFGPTTLNSFGNLDIFVATVDLATGDFETVYQNGGPLDDEARGITASTSNTSFITGYFNGQGSFGNVDLTSAGDWDIFVHKFTLVVAPDLANGLVAWYKMNGNANDASGNGNNGFAQNITSTVDRSNSANKAYLFQPSLSGVDVLGIDPINVAGAATTNASTYLAWIKTAPNFEISNIPKPIFCTSFDDSENRLIQLSDIGTITYTFNSNIGNMQVNQNSVVPIQDNSWHHLAVVFKSGIEIIFYLDGNEIGRQNLTYFFLPETFLGTHWNIGHMTTMNRSTQVYSFDGSIDDVRIYRRALSSAEVNFIKNQSATNSLVEESENKSAKVSPEVKLWPNPSSGKLNFDLGSKAKNFEIKILDISGIEVMNKTINNLDDSYLSLDLQNLNTGYYFVQLNIDGQTNIQKLIISK